MGVKLYNTLGRAIQEFQPIDNSEVGLYCCGSTVYNYAHIGNLRTYVFEDILRRALEYAGYNVNHVMNITDVGHLEDELAGEGEDRISKKARLEQLEPMEVVQKYMNSYHKNMDQLNTLKPSIEPQASGHII